LQQLVIYKLLGGPPQEEPYGYRIHDFSLGSLHNHIINYKIDIDVLGTKNKLQTINFVRETRTLPWFDIPWTQLRINRQIVQNETESAFLYDINDPMIFLFQTDQLNKWGNPRSYRIYSFPFIKNLVADLPVWNCAYYSRYTTIVTQRKETEPSSNSVYDQAHNAQPVVNFENFLNGENLVDEDLVVWANVGLFHLAHAEDVPTTLAAGNYMSIFVRPFNYFDEDPSMDLLQSIVIRRDENGNPIEEPQNDLPAFEPCVPTEQDVPFGLVDRY